MQEKFALAATLGLKMHCFFVRFDVQIEKEHLVCRDDAIRIRHIHPPQEDALDLGTRQGDARFVGVLEHVIVTRLSIYDLARRIGLRIRTFLTHGGGILLEATTGTFQAMKRFVPALPLAALLILGGCAEDKVETVPVVPNDKGGVTAQTPPKAAGLKELKIENVKKGDGVVQGVKVKGDVAVAEGDRVSVAYRGIFMNGEEFDTNMKPGADPFTLVVGSGQVIKGWEQGLVGMRIGGERKLSVPSELAYGKPGYGGRIPPNADLMFTIRLLDVVKQGEETVFDKTDLKSGSGREVKIGDTVSIEYTGTLVNGKEFDSNVDEKPYSFKLTPDTDPEGVIAGMNAGIKGMKRGGERLIRIPPLLGYGEPGTEGIPPDSTLVFRVKLLSFK